MSGDRLRDEIAAVLTAARDNEIVATVRGERDVRDDRSYDAVLADAVLPVVQARIDAAREQMAHEAWQQGYAAGKEQAAEQIAQAIEAEYVDSPWIRRATDIARQHAKGDGDAQP